MVIRFACPPLRGWPRSLRLSVFTMMSCLIRYMGQPDYIENYTWERRCTANNNNAKCLRGEEVVKRQPTSGRFPQLCLVHVQHRGNIEKAHRGNILVW